MQVSSCPVFLSKHWLMKVVFRVGIVPRWNIQEILEQIFYSSQDVFQADAGIPPWTKRLSLDSLSDAVKVTSHNSLRTALRFQNIAFENGRWGQDWLNVEKTTRHGAGRGERDWSTNTTWCFRWVVYKTRGLIVCSGYLFGVVSFCLVFLLCFFFSFYPEENNIKK